MKIKSFEIGFGTWNPTFWTYHFFIPTCIFRQMPHRFPDGDRSRLAHESIRLEWLGLKIILSYGFREEAIGLKLHSYWKDCSDVYFGDKKIALCMPTSIAARWKSDIENKMPRAIELFEKYVNRLPEGIDPRFAKAMRRECTREVRDFYYPETNPPTLAERSRTDTIR